jgi:hypothetical protein
VNDLIGSGVLSHALQVFGLDGYVVEKCLHVYSFTSDLASSNCLNALCNPAQSGLEILLLLGRDLALLDLV